MNIQQTYTRHDWLAVKQTISRNTAPSFLNIGSEAGFIRYRNRKYAAPGTYYIDIIGIFEKISIFLKGISTIFAFSFQTEWHHTPKPTSS